MLIDELLLELDINTAKSAAKTLVKGTGEFIKGARGGKDIINPLSGKSIFSYGDGAETTTRSVGASLTRSQQFQNLVKNVYDDPTEELVQDWREAILSNNDKKVKEVGAKYRDKQKTPGDWKRSNRDLVRTLMKHYSKNSQEKPTDERL